MKCSTTTYGSDKERVNVIGFLVGGRNLQKHTFQQGVMHLIWDKIIWHNSTPFMWITNNGINLHFSADSLDV